MFGLSISSISSFSTHRLNILTLIICMNTFLVSSLSILNLLLYTWNMLSITSSFMNPGSFPMKSNSFTRSSVYNESPSNPSYFFESPVKFYLRFIFSIMTSFSLFLYIFNDSLNVTSKILLLTNVNNTTPMTMHIALNILSWLLLVDTSPYPTVVTVWITKYHAL